MSVCSNHEDYGQFSAFKIIFPPLHLGVSITQVLEVRIDIPITGLFLEVGFLVPRLFVRSLSEV